MIPLLIIIVVVLFVWNIVLDIRLSSARTELEKEREQRRNLGDFVARINGRLIKAERDIEYNKSLAEREPGEL